MYKILEKQVLSDVTKLMVIEAPHVARNAKAGQFVIVIADEQGERIPLTIADHDPVAGTVTLIFQEVGKSTMQMGTMNVGDGFYSVAGPLGHPTEIEAYGTVVCVAGGVGIAPMYPIARDLKRAGNHVIMIMGARNKELLFWEDKMAAVSDELIVCTDDGSYGRKALVTEPLKEILDRAAGRGRQGVGHRADDHDEVRLVDHPTVQRADHRQPELHHDRWHGDVRRVPRRDDRRRQVRVRGRPGVRRSPGGLGQSALPRPVL